MNTSETINEIAAALAKAQAAMKNAALNKVNPHFKAKYADLAGIRDAVLPHLSANGIAVVQCTNVAYDFVLTTRLIHTSGQWLESSFPLPMNPEKPQVVGSALTYARRYSLAAMAGIAAEEDDDGNAAQAEAKAPPASTAPKPDVPGDAEAYEELRKSVWKMIGVDAADNMEGSGALGDFTPEMAAEALQKLTERSRSMAGSDDLNRCNAEQKDRLRTLVGDIRETLKARSAE